jgi:hypothetical protein
MFVEDNRREAQERRGDPEDLDVASKALKVGFVGQWK